MSRRESQRSTVSVVMPVRNARRFVRQALSSILRQSCPPDEVIVVDDGSTDGTALGLDSMPLADRRVVLIAGPRVGIVEALNCGLRLSSCELVARMDADDISYPDRICVQARYLSEHEECVAVGSNVHYLDEDGMVLFATSLPQHHESIQSGLFQGRSDFLRHPAVMLRREAVVGVGGYRREAEWAEDLDLYLRLAEVGRLANVRDVLLGYRLHRGSVGRERSRLQGARVAWIIKDACARRGCSPLTRMPPRARPRRSTAASKSSWAVKTLVEGNWHAASRPRHIGSGLCRPSSGSPTCL